ncbi:MAG: hypothetical protein ABL889_16235 [Terricaulis sp.]
MIEIYWRNQGFVVTVEHHNAGFHPATRSARFDVRSDMRNGWPRAKFTAEAEPNFGL